MTTLQILALLRNFLSERFHVSSTDPDFSADVHLFDYGYIDSFGAVELIGFVAKAFGVTISPSDLIVFPLNTLQEIATFVSKRRAGDI